MVIFTKQHLYISIKIIRLDENNWIQLKIQCNEETIFVNAFYSSPNVSNIENFSHALQDMLETYPKPFLNSLYLGDINEDLF